MVLQSSTYIGRVAASRLLAIPITVIVLQSEDDSVTQCL
jgi:hypothetical protein